MAKTEDISIKITSEPPAVKVPVGISTYLAIAYAVLALIGAVLVFLADPSAEEASGGVAAVITAAAALWKLIESRGKQAETFAAVAANHTFRDGVSYPAPTLVEPGFVEPQRSNEPDEDADLDHYGVELAEALDVDAATLEELPVQDRGEGQGVSDRDVMGEQREKEVRDALAAAGDDTEVQS